MTAGAGLQQPVCVILAAGGGRRLGGVAKALIPWGDQSESLLGVRAVQAALDAGFQPVLVLGHQSTRVQRELQRHAPEVMQQVKVVYADGWERGMAASFQAGVQAAVNAGASQCAVMLVDQPGIGAEALWRVRAAHVSGRITRGGFGGEGSELRGGHPVMFEIDDAVAAAASATGDAGARAYLKTHRHRITLVDVRSYADLGDIDTPEDLNSWGIQR